MPGGSLASFQFDDEGSLLSQTLTFTTASRSYTSAVPSQTDSNTINVRNELLNSSQSLSANRSANGFMPPSSYHAQPIKNGQFDAILGRNLQYATTNPFASQCAQGTESASSCNQYSYSFAYDSLGNMTSQSYDTPNLSSGTDSNGGTGRTFDFEHHTTQAVASILAAYQWNAAGHPARIGTNVKGSSTQYDYDAVHWDGDVVLYTTLPSGAIDDIKLGDYGDYAQLDATGSLQYSFEFVERDSAGEIIAEYNDAAGSNYIVNGFPDHYQMQPSKGAGAAVGPNIPYYATGSNINSKGDVGQGGILGMPRTDGIFDGINTIQGVRTYEPTSQSWTSPDAYAGDVRDPESQKSFVWNNGNPEAYNDPSGYDALLINDKQGAFAVGHEFVFVYNPKTGEGLEFSQGPEHNGHLIDKKVITATEHNVADYKSLDLKRYKIQHVSQSSKTDKKELLYGDERVASEGEYNALTNNCAQFVRDLLYSGGSDVLPFFDQSMIPNVNGNFFSGGLEGAPSTQPPPQHRSDK